jgi:hypothetical protein
MTHSLRTVLAVCAVVAAVMVSSPLHDPLNNPNEGVRVFTVKALVEQHTLAINDVTRAWGFIDDKAIRGGRLYQSKAPLVSLLAAAAYAVVHPITGDLSRPALTRLCRLSGGAVPVALLLGVTWWALRQRRRPAPDDDTGDHDVLVDLVMVGLVLGTGVLASLQVFSGHALAAVAPATVLALARLPGRTWHSVVAAMALSAAATAEYPAALCVPLLWLVVRRAPDRRQAIFAAFVAGVVVALPTLIAHHSMWGAPWRTGYSFLENPQYQPLVRGTFFGIGLPSPSVLVTTLVSPELGLFFFSPFLLLGLLWLARGKAGGVDRVDVVVVVGVVLGFILFIAGFRGWRGGWSVGPRYILELAGVLAVCAVDGVGVLPRRSRLPLLMTLVVVSVLHSGLAGAFFPHLPDVLRAPVGELLLPLIARGFCPDSLPLWLGASASFAAFVVAGVVLAAPVIVCLAHRRFTAALAVLVLIPVAWLETATVSVGAVRAKEVRRVTDNWRPEAGNPYLVDVDSAPVGTRLAIDRARTLGPRLPPPCTDAPRPRRRDIGPGTVALRNALDGLEPTAPTSFVVVDDALADHMGAAGGAHLIAALSDMPRLRGFPCAGPIVVVVRPETTLPPSLSSLPLIDERGVGDGFVVRRLQRPVATR